MERNATMSKTWNDWNDLAMRAHGNAVGSEG
jgi:hypothetical protein